MGHPDPGDSWERHKSRLPKDRILKIPVSAAVRWLRAWWRGRRKKREGRVKR